MPLCMPLHAQGYSKLVWAYDVEKQNVAGSEPWMKELSVNYGFTFLSFQPETRLRYLLWDY